MLAALLSASPLGCGQEIRIGEPPEVADEPPPSAPDAPPGDASRPIVEGTRAPDLAWQWLNPRGSGVNLRAAFVLPTEERWLVGDQGVVLRERLGEVTRVRLGDVEEVLSAVWGTAPDDVWVGGARGGVGVLAHWDGTRWDESLKFGAAPVRAIHGTPESRDLFVVVGSSGFRLPRNGGTVTPCPVLRSVRDVWVQSGREAFFVGDDGIGRLTLERGCEKVSDIPAFAVWGDGRGRIVVARSDDASVVEYDGAAFRELARPSAPPQPLDTQDALGKRIASDDEGRIAILYRSSAADRPGLVATLTGVASPKVSVRAQETGERMNGLATGTRIVFAGDRGLRGALVGETPVNDGGTARENLRFGMPAPDGSLYAAAGRQGQEEAVVRWSERTGWSRLASLPAGYSIVGGVAASGTDVWLGGLVSAQARGQQTAYFGLRLRDFGWERALENTGYPTRPLVASSESNVWASVDLELARFDGSTWSRFSASASMRAASARNANDVWLVDVRGQLWHWDGVAVRPKASLPAQNTLGSVNDTGEFGAIVELDGAVFVRTQRRPEVTPTDAPTSGQPALLRFDGSAWGEVPLPGLAPRSIARGPDGKLRVLASVSVNPAWFDAGSAIYVLEGERLRRELELPRGVYLTHLVTLPMDRSGATALYAIGASGATLRLDRAEPAPK